MLMKRHPRLTTLTSSEYGLDELRGSVFDSEFPVETIGAFQSCSVVVPQLRSPPIAANVMQQIWVVTNSYKKKSQKSIYGHPDGVRGHVALQKPSNILG